MTWKHFSYATDPMLACPCCHKEGMNPEFMIRLDGLRDEIDRPIIISSGYRCPEYNDIMSETGLDGPHTTGMAIDTPISGHEAYFLMKIALRLGITGIGVRQKGGDRILHLDKANVTPRPWVWSY